MQSNPNDLPELDTPKSTEQPSRRSFLIAVAAAGGALGLWALRRLPVSAVQASEGAAKTGPVTIVEFGADGKRIGTVTKPRTIKTDAEWKQQLSPAAYNITRLAGTEFAYSGSTWDLHDRGLFRCICCDTALFSSETKFDSGTGWPSFWQPIAAENVTETRDSTFGMTRTAVSCSLCAGHLGHVFDDGPAPTGLRYCMNSAAMRFVKLA